VKLSGWPQPFAFPYISESYPNVEDLLCTRTAQLRKDIFKAGIFVEPELIPHSNPEWKIDKQRVVVNRAGILRCRPRLDDWSLSFTILVREERLQPRVIQDILHHAGKFHGIGDFRPRYGLFQVSTFEIQ
jgi:hypothetical protein